MTKTLTDMIAELKEDVPAVDGIPSDTQYERAIRDAVAEFSRRCGLKKHGEIAIVAGTATYDLPAGFLMLIELENPFCGGAVVTPTGIIPDSKLSRHEEEYTIRNGTITFVPTPTYSLTRYFEYKAAWVLDDDAYDLTEDEAQIVLLKAQAFCFEKLANASAAQGFRYSVGNMSVDKSGVSDGYVKRQFDLHGQFVDACSKYNGSVLYA